MYGRDVHEDLFDLLSRHPVLATLGPIAVVPVKALNFIRIYSLV
jgi:hypothetical protein